MNNRGFLIRFIDVGLIVLFGFISISDINIKAQLKLPSSLPDKQDTQQLSIAIIRILEGGTYMLEEVETETGRKNIEDWRELEGLLLELEKKLLAEGKEMVVLIEPDDNSKIQLTIDIMDMCDRNNIQKNINSTTLEL